MNATALTQYPYGQGETACRLQPGWSGPCRHPQMALAARHRLQCRPSGQETRSLGWPLRRRVVHQEGGGG